MLKIIFTVIFTFIFAKFMLVACSEEYSGLSKKITVDYKVVAKEGILACSTQNTYKQIQIYYNNNETNKIKEEIEKKNCIFLKNGEELKGYEGICDIKNLNEVKLFKTEKYLLHKLYIPCFAVEEFLPEIIEKNDDETKINNQEIPVNDNISDELEFEN
ncbi:MAG: hypothetical protein ACO201_04525 [Rickettsiales bacterium]